MKKLPNSFSNVKMLPAGRRCMKLLTLCLLVLFVACKPANPPAQGEPEIDDPSVASTMQLLLNGVGPLTKDTTITVSEAELSLSGKMQMAVTGEISGIKAFRVVITRSAQDRDDEFCAADKCCPNNGDVEQVLNFTVRDGDASSWYAHYNLPAEGDTRYTVKYKFINYSRVITLTVVYDYKE